MQPIGVAVIGAGYWGPNLVRNFQASSDLDLRWLCDLDEERARQVALGVGGLRTTPDLEVVLSDPSVDAVAIATPARTHLQVARQALEAGKHVLVEKPLATSYADAAELVDTAERLNRVLMCDHTYCYTPAVQKIHEVVQSGMLGELHFFDSVRINLGIVQRDVNVLWDLAPHDLSILDFVLPEGCRPQAVAAHGADPIGAGQVCIAYLTVQLGGGAIAHTHVNWLSPTKVRTTIVGGSKRTLVWDDLNPVQRISIFDRGVDMASPGELDPEERREAAVSYRTGDMIAPALPEGEALRGVASEFASAIREGRPARTDGRSGLRVLDVLEAASASLEYRGAVVPLRSAR